VRPSRRVSFSLFTKYGLIVLKQGLDCHTLLLNVGEFTLDVYGSHNRGCKDDGKVKRSHLRCVSSILLAIDIVTLTKLSLAC
jgi:hypothetical protein